MLQSFAATHNVKMVVVSIGGNDFNFASIVQQCVTDFLASPTWLKDYCNDDSSVKANFTAANVAAQRARIATAYGNLRTAMRNAGYADGSWTMLVQNYPSPLPPGAGFRYGESGYSRQSTGGCGFWNADATWANTTALPTINAAVTGAATDAGIANLRTLDLASAFNGRRLCENTVGPLRGEGPDLVDPGRRGGQDRVGQPDPHRVDLLLEQPLLRPGVAAPELLGPAGHPLVRAAGVERRQHPRRRLHDRRDRAAQRRAADDPGLIRWSERIAWCFRL